MLNNETRELLVEAYKNYTVKELSEIFYLHISNFYRIVKLQTNKMGRKFVLTEKDLKNISGLIDFVARYNN